MKMVPYNIIISRETLVRIMSEPSLEALHYQSDKNISVYLEIFNFMFLPLALVKLNLLSASMDVLYSTGVGEQLLTYTSTLILGLGEELVERPEMTFKACK